MTSESIKDSEGQVAPPALAPYAAGTQPQDEGRLQCLECGRWYRSLASHLIQGEGIELDTYRERHGLPATLPLASTQLRSLWREQTRQRRQRGELPTEVDPDRREAGRRNGVSRRSQTAGRPGVRKIHQAGMAKARARAVANARAELRELAIGLGYTDWEELIIRTCGQDTATLARLVGRDRQTITYWRRKIIGPDWKAAAGYVRPARAAAFDRLDGLFAARGWPTLAEALAGPPRIGIRRLARELSTTSATLRAWEEHRRQERSVHTAGHHDDEDHDVSDDHESDDEEEKEPRRAVLEDPALFHRAESSLAPGDPFGEFLVVRLLPVTEIITGHHEHSCRCARS
jgi:hypothetical protein